MRSKLLLLGLLAFHTTLGFGQVYGDYLTLRNDTIDMLDFRTKAYNEFKVLHDKTSKKLPLNGGELNLIHQTIVERKSISDRIIKFLLENINIGKNHYNVFIESQDLNDEFVDNESDDFEIPLQLENKNLNLSLKDQRELVRFLGIALTFADNYLQTIFFYQDDPTLRRVINEEGSIPGKPGNELKNHLKKLLTRKNIKNLSKALFIYSKIRNDLIVLGEKDEEFKFWTKVIDNSFINDELKKKNINLSDDNEEIDQSEVFHKLLKLFRHKKKRSDFFHTTSMKIMHVLSKAFGNTAGRFQSRYGLLKDRADVIADLKSTLRPLDILLEKTPFRLTDHFIPGYYGHNAIWLGTEDELKSLGLWDHPVFRPLQDKIRNGQSIVEALRPGVTINSVEHFLDIDDLAVMRIKSISEEDLKKSLVVAAQQYGKAYDFNFDIHTQDVLVCSELIFMSFLNIDFRTERVAGRWTINPDAVAERSIPNQEFDVQLFYVGGKKVENKLPEKMAYLLANANKKDEQLLEDFKKFDEQDNEEKRLVQKVFSKIKILLD
jgi:hypothetical protein